MYDIAAYMPQEGRLSDDFRSTMDGDRSLRHSNADNDGLEVESERLRAALHGTPGGGSFKDAMFQLGLTPASDDRRRSSDIRLGRRLSGALGRDSRAGRLSEKYVYSRDA